MAIKFIDMTGKTENEAIEKALRELGLERDDVSVEILERAKSGFLGIGASPAKVRVTYGLEDEEPVGWDEKAGGFLCRACLPVYARPLPQGQPQWLRSALTGGPDAYLTLNDADAPFALLKNYVESRLDKPIKSGAMLV